MTAKRLRSGGRAFDNDRARQPRRRPLDAELVWTLGAAVGAVLVLAPRLQLLAPTDDDGILAANALRVAGGAAPYRDYFSALTPGADFLYGLWFWVFGASYFEYRCLTAAALVVAAVALQRISRRLLPGPWATAVAIAWTAWCGMFLRIGPYHFVAVALVLLMLLVLIRPSRAHRLAECTLAGALGGLAVLFVQSAGPAVAAGLAFFVLVAPAPSRIRSGGACAFGVLIAVSPLTVWLAMSGLFSEFVDQTLSFVADSYVPTHRLATPLVPQRLTSFPLETWAYFGTLAGRALQVGFWLVAFATQVAIIAGLLVLAVRRPVGAMQRTDILGIGVVSAGLFLPVLVFPWAPHAWVNAGLALPILVWATRWLASAVPFGRALTGLAAVGLASAIVAPPMLGILVRTGVRDQDRFQPVHANGATVLVHRFNAETLERILAFADQHPRDEIAFLPQLPTVYLLSGRQPPVSHVLLLPGYSTPAQVDDVAAELADRGVRWVIYARVSQASLQASLPEVADRSKGRTWEFERLLARKYVRCLTLGEIVPLGPVIVYERRREINNRMCTYPSANG